MERRRNQREYDDIGFGVLENNRGTGFEALLLSRMNRLFSSGNVTSRDMQRAILSSFAAAVGAESLPPMFLLDEESAEEEEDEDVEVVISAPESHTATTEGPLPVPFSTDEAATSSSLPTSTSLDPTSPVFVPSYLDSLRPLPPGPSADPDADDDHPDSRSVVDNIITSPAPYLWNAGDILRDWAERHPPSGESSSSTTVVSAAPEAPSSSSAAQAEEDSQAAVAGVVHDSDPPFMTDGRGRVVWSSTTSARAREGRRGRATSSSATIVPHIKSSPDMSTASEESSDDTAQHHSHRLRPSSLSGRLVRQRSLPLVGSNDDAFELSAEFVTDGRGRVVFANKR
ncbi:hypothetical protein C8Q80DRAFT_166101 [Daedaleopsis nitida]|nr:hypothetical protein C8Q80DRAFT_166101 [Daedaleopsis nitida]